MKIKDLASGTTVKINGNKKVIWSVVKMDMPRTNCIPKIDSVNITRASKLPVEIQFFLWDENTEKYWLSEIAD